MKDGLVYRICRRCGETVNVSCKERQEKKYLCPRCAGVPWYMTREWSYREDRKGPRRN